MCPGCIAGSTEVTWGARYDGWSILTSSLMDTVFRGEAGDGGGARTRGTGLPVTSSRRISGGKKAL